MDMNVVNLVGRLADNVHYTPEQGDKSSRAVGRLIVNRPPSKDGERRLDAIQIVAWGKHADNLAKYTSKGKELGIQGELRVNSVRPTKEGEDWKNYTEVLVRSVSFGRDSNQAKMMKALTGGGDTVAQALAALGSTGGNAGFAAILQNPAVQAALANVTQGAQAPETTTETEPHRAETTEDEDIEESEDTAETPFSG